MPSKMRQSNGESQRSLENSGGQLLVRVEFTSAREAP